MLAIYDIINELGRSILFLLELKRTMFESTFRLRSVFEQTWNVTIASLPTTAMAGFFVGAITTIQFTLQMKELDALGFLGGLATSGTIREVGPLLIAFMLSGKVGAFTSAELGTMRVTEQIDAIRCLGADPLQEIVLPRFIGIIFSSFFLLTLGLFMSIFGGIILGQIFAGVNPEEYIRHIPTILNWASVTSGLVKCLVFAFVLATICTYKGYNTTGGAKGVGRAVVSTAVSTMVSIVVLDWITSYIGNIILKLWMD